MPCPPRLLALHVETLCRNLVLSHLLVLSCCCCCCCLCGLQVLGLNVSYPEAVKAADINQQTLKQAAAMVPTAALQQYQLHGQQLTVSDDKVYPSREADEFVTSVPIQFRAAAIASNTNSSGSSSNSSSGTANLQSVRGSTRMGVEVASPLLTTPSPSEAQQAAAQLAQADALEAASVLAAVHDSYMHRFLGVWYSKVLSVAQVVEWIMVGSFWPAC